MKIRNIIFIVFVVISLLLSLNIMSYANSTFDPGYYEPGKLDVSDAGKAIQLGEKIIGVITTIGTVVSVVVTMGMGIKYITGSVEEKAEYKKSMMPILIGMILLFGISWIITLIFNVVSNIKI